MHSGPRKYQYKKLYLDGKMQASVDRWLTREHGQYWLEYRGEPAQVTGGWFVKADSFIAHRKATGSNPYKGATKPETRKLGQWLADSIARHKKGSLEDDRIVWLDKNIPEWRRSKNSDQWNMAASDVYDFLVINQHWPSTYKTEKAEKSLGQWLGKQTLNITNKTLNDDRKRWLDDNLPGWDRRSSKEIDPIPKPLRRAK